jgi:hypothetical protein
MARPLMIPPHMSTHGVHDAQTLRMNGSAARGFRQAREAGPGRRAAETMPAFRRPLRPSDSLDHPFFSETIEYDPVDYLGDDDLVPARRQRGGLALLAGIAVGLAATGLMWMASGRHHPAPAPRPPETACDGKPCVDPLALAPAPAPPVAAPAPAAPAAAPAPAAPVATTAPVAAAPVTAPVPAVAPVAVPATPAATAEPAEEPDTRGNQRRAAAPLRDMVWSDRMQRLVPSDFVPPPESQPVAPVPAAPAVAPAAAPPLPANR